MIVTNQVFYKGMMFDEYLSMPGWSYSGIKNYGKPPITETHKMRLGTKVHTYCLVPEEYDHSDARIVKPAARALMEVVGILIKYLIPELAVTAHFSFQGITMAYKGRMDLVLPGKIVIDFKVSELDISKAIQFFGYDKQLSGYSLAAGCKRAIIIGINPKTLKTSIVDIPINPYWWEYQAMAKGGIIK